ncbi:MAG: hypothetical protein PVG37_03395 [Desulfobacterales bacterium]|jgi:hypothetical protein
MKKIMYLFIILSVLMVFGCGKDSPEDVAKDYVKKQFKLDNAEKLDTSDLKYTVTEDPEANNATVKVSGSIKYEEQIHLIQKKGKWVISKEKIANSKNKGSH